MLTFGACAVYSSTVNGPTEVSKDTYVGSAMVLVQEVSDRPWFKMACFSSADGCFGIWFRASIEVGHVHPPDGGLLRVTVFLSGVRTRLSPVLNRSRWDGMASWARSRAWMPSARSVHRAYPSGHELMPQTMEDVKVKTRTGALCELATLDSGC